MSNLDFLRCLLVDKATILSSSSESSRKITGTASYPNSLAILRRKLPEITTKLERLTKIGWITPNSRILFMNPFGFCDYIKLQMEALCVLSDSGTISEESSILNFPAITIRNAHERPEGMDAGTLIMSGLKSERVLQAVDVIIKQSSGQRRISKIITDYEAECVSAQVLRVVLSYIDYINRTVWAK